MKELAQISNDDNVDRQMVISLQCDISPNVGGDLITAVDQKRRLELAIETARQLWG